MYSSHLPIPLLVLHYKQNKGKVTDNYFTLFPQKEEFDEEELELKSPATQSWTERSQSLLQLQLKLVFNQKLFTKSQTFAMLNGKKIYTGIFKNAPFEFFSFPWSKAPKKYLKA